MSIPARRAWAYGHIRGCPKPPPTYGSPDWCDLDDTDPAKTAAAIIAAEAWARDGDDIEGRMEVAIAEGKAADKAAEDTGYRWAVAEHRQQWGHLGVVRAYRPRTLEERLAEARGPRQPDGAA